MTFIATYKTLCLLAKLMKRFIGTFLVKDHLRIDGGGGGRGDGLRFYYNHILLHCMCCLYFFIFLNVIISFCKHYYSAVEVG